MVPIHTELCGESVVLCNHSLRPICASISLRKRQDQVDQFTIAAHQGTLECIGNATFCSEDPVTTECLDQNHRSRSIDGKETNVFGHLQRESIGNRFESVAVDNRLSQGQSTKNPRCQCVSDQSESGGQTVESGRWRIEESNRKREKL